MNQKLKDTQDVKEALKLLWDALEVYKKGKHHNNFNRPLLNLQPHLKNVAARMKVDLGAKRFERTQETNFVPIAPEVEPPQEQEEERVVAADNAETPKAKKRASKRRRKKPE